MKIRNGFVSNSSSSSFVIAIGRVTNSELLQELIEKYHIGSWDAKLCEYPDLCDDLEVESFMGNSVSVDKSMLSPGDNILKFDYAGGEGDGYFCNDDCDIDYDIDFEDLPSNIVDFIHSVQSCVDLFEMTYGAGRNG